MKKLCIVLLGLLAFMPILVNAKDLKEYEYEDASLKFTIDKDYWLEDEFKTNPTLLDKKWKSKCGIVTTSVIDAYNELSEEFPSSVSRKDINYLTVFSDDSDETLKSFIDNFTENMDIDITDYNYVEYNVKFLHFYGTQTKDDIEMYGEYYFTINNGYFFSIQYLSNKTDSLICDYTIDQIAKSMYSTIKNDNTEYNELNALTIIIDLILTIIGYMIYPFIRIKIMKHEYTKKQAKKMIIWNSIIVGLIFAIITYSLYGSNTTTNVINFAPALFYYYINYAVWVSKLGDDNSKTEEKGKEKTKKDKGTNTSINTFTCDNCGASVSKDAVKCPKCGCSFEEEKSDSIEQLVCDKCGNLVSSSAKRCPKCGEVFEEDNELEEESKTISGKQKVDKSESTMDRKYSDLKTIRQRNNNKRRI